MKGPLELPPSPAKGREWDRWAGTLNPGGHHPQVIIIAKKFPARKRIFSSPLPKFDCKF